MQAYRARARLAGAKTTVLRRFAVSKAVLFKMRSDANLRRATFVRTRARSGRDRRREVSGSVKIGRMNTVPACWSPGGFRAGVLDDCQR